MVSRGRDAINFGRCTMDRKLAEMSSENCELSTSNCELGAVHCCFALMLAIFTITGVLGCNFAAFWTSSDASWKPLGGLVKTFYSFSSHLGSLLNRLREAPSRQYAFGC